MVSGSPAQTSPRLVIDPHRVHCVVAGRFPRLEATITPSAQVARAHMLFRSPGFPGWYSVAMTAAGDAFTGVLPRPKKALREIEYYVEAADSAFDVVRTPDMRVAVVAGPADCEGDRVVAGVAETASVVLESPAGAPPVPAGFESAGVASSSAAASGAAGLAAAGAAAGGHGLPIAIAVGASAAVAGVAVAAKGGDSSQAAGGDGGAPADIPGGIQVSPAGTLLASATLAAFSTQDRGPGSHEWSFGDGATASGLQVAHTFADPGTYAVVLTVKDARDITVATARTSVTVGSLTGRWTLVTGVPLEPGCYSTLNQVGRFLSGTYCASDPDETIPRGQVSDPRRVALTVYFPCTGVGSPGEANYEGEADASLNQIALRLASRSTACGYQSLQLSRQ
jgi:hypothetical protein